VEVGRKLGAFLGADALGALAREVAPEAPEERSQDQRKAGGRGDHGEHHVLRVAEDVVGGEKEQHRADHECDPEPAAVEVGDPGARSSGLWRGQGTGMRGDAFRLGGHRPRLTPEQRRSGAGQDERPDQRV
jgi:hypothetical protein